MANNTYDTPDFKKMAELFFAGLSPQLAEHAKAFFRASFDKQGFTDSSFVAWPMRLDDQTFGYTHRLLSKSRTLQDSITITEASQDRVAISAGDGIPYAAIHNNGGTIRVKVTDKMRRFYWFVYKSLAGHHSYSSEPPDYILKWKKMALTKKAFIIIQTPKRQYIGDSSQLLKEIDAIIIEKIKLAQQQVLGQ